MASSRFLSKRFNRPLALVASAALAAVPVSTALAGLDQTRSNYVGGNWGDAWKNIANWGPLTAYPTQAPDGGGDISYIAMAHDDNALYINFNQGTNFALGYGDENIYFDTDLNSATGNTTDSWWWGAPTRVGAERSMYGPAIWKTENPSWDGTSIDDSTTYGGHNNFLIKISLSKLNNPAAFNWTGRMFGGGGTDDYYPRAVGDYHRYNVAAAADAPHDWNAVSANYTNVANWNPGSLPTLADTTTIGNGGTAIVNTSGANGAQALTLNVGASSGNGVLEVQSGGDLFVRNSLRLGIGTGTGTVNQSGGQVRVDFGNDKNLRIGFDAGGTGFYNLSGGELAVGDSFTVGKDGTGTFTMTGGVVSKAGFITVGRSAGSNGTFDMSGGVVNQSFGDFEIGNLSTGAVHLSGGTFNVAPSRAFAVGNRIGGVGTATISGTALVVTSAGGDVFIGGNDNTGTQLGGTGTLNINGGEVQDDDDFIIGNFGTGTLNMSGGLVSKSGWIVIGNNPGAVGTFNMTGGTINQTFGDLEVGDEGSGTLNLSGGTLNIAGNVYVSKSAGGAGDANISGGTLSTQKVLSLTNNSFDVSGTGTVKMYATGTGTQVSVIRAFSVTGSGRIDITDNKIVTKNAVGTASAGVYSGVSGLIQSGRNGGNWSGSGIVTSVATGSLTGIGVATAQQVKGLANAGDTAVWAGETVTGSDTLVMYTYGGDANLDGKINVDDYGRIDLNIPLGTSGWYNGDFNYDGKINVDDYGIIDFNIGIQGAPFSTVGPAASAGLSAVPEPAAAVSLLVISNVLACGRRRRRAVFIVRRDSKS